MVFQFIVIRIVSCEVNWRKVAVVNCSLLVNCLNGGPSFFMSGEGFLAIVFFFFWREGGKDY